MVLPKRYVVLNILSTIYFTFYSILVGCRTSIPVGIESGHIPDRAFLASSFRSNSGWLAPSFMARLNARDARRGRNSYMGAWCAGRQRANEYLQV